MKKLLMMLPILAIAGIANAQTEGFSKGSVFASGTLAFGSQSFDEEKTTAFTFSPKVGYFLTNNVAVGLNLGISSAKFDDGFDETKMSGFNAGAFGRYYFTPANKFSMFLNLGFDYLTSKVEEEGFPDQKENGFSIGFAPGFNYFISNRLAIEAYVGVLGYTSTKPDFDGAESTNTFSFGVNTNDINFGLVYKFK